MCCFTVTDAGSSGVLTGFGVSGELRPCGGDQAVVSQLLYPQVPGGAAIYPVVPRRHPLIVVFSGAVCGEDERLRRGSDAWEARKEQGRTEINIKVFTLQPETMHSEKNSTAQKKEYFGVLILVFTPSQKSFHSFRRNPVMEESSTEKLLYFILFTFGEVQKDVGSAVWLLQVMQDGRGAGCDPRRGVRLDH